MGKQAKRRVTVTSDRGEMGDGRWEMESWPERQAEAEAEVASAATAAGYWTGLAWIGLDWTARR